MENAKTLSIAVDGPSGAGKSSLSKQIAKNFNFIYVDTGAMYRTIGLYCLKNGVDLHDASALEQAYPQIHIDIRYDESGLQRMILNGADVTEEIRMPEVSIAASDVSAQPSCRAFLLETQREFARNNSVIMDGRDIGTVVLPNADVKIYLTASAEARAQRRLKELLEKGVEASYEDTLKDIEYRDYQDTHREVAPLKQAEDAILVDTSDINFEQSLDLLCSIIADRLI